MAIITRLIPHYTQPQSSVEIDFANPLTKGLSLCFVPPKINGWQNAGLNDPLPDTATSRIEPGPFGLKGSVHNFADAWNYTNQTKYDGSALSFFVLENSRFLNNTRNFLGKWADSANNDSWILRTEAGVLKAYINTGAAWVAASAGTATTGKLETLAGTYDGAQITAYVNGIAGTPAAKTGTTSSASNVRIGRGGLALPSPYDEINADIYLALVWQRALSAQEIRRLTDSPWQIFKPRKRGLYVVAAASGAALAGDAASTATASGTLAGVDLSGASTATSNATAGLSLGIPLAGNASTVILRPNADSVDGLWTPSTGLDLYPMVSKTAQDDSTYIIGVNTSGNIGYVNLSDTADPGISTGHSLLIRAWSVTAGGSMFVNLFRPNQGNAMARQVKVTTVPANYILDLTAAEADSITDYNALQVSMQVLAGSPNCHISQIELRIAQGAEATATGTLFVSVPLAAAGLSVATATGAISVSIPLAASAQALPGATADLTVTGGSSLAGVATATANATGGLSLSVPLSASAVAQALASAGITQGVPLSGVAIAQALASATLSAGVTLSGAAIAQAVAIAALTHGVPLDGDAIATAVASAGLSNGITLSGAALSEALAAAGLAIAKALQAAALATATASGGLSINISLSGAAIAQASASAGLSVTGNGLQGDATAAAAASGALTHGVPLTGAALSVSASTGNVTQLVPLAGSAAAASFATGGLDLSVKLSGAALAQALAAAGLTVQGGLSGGATDVSTATGTVTLTVNLNGAALAQAIADGALTTDGLLTAATPGWIIKQPARNWTIQQPARNWRIAS